MTNKEAHRFLEDLQRKYTRDRHLYKPEFIEANGLAILSLEKQIAKKPIDNHHCPSCKAGLPHRGITDEWCKCCFDPDFCPECGQRLNWSDLK